ncbi:GntR family transcriptional regulator [Sphaerisporangium krabiense]|uniref:DNA-binding GntR family transcriptional regulator n=2 Tax=Sphaerisporangium krabiense TaxID=763782 RepID=A0A7W8Z246_9ACTN|nr:GntR family transcriptional regulator [Sphaerisporangium krabiense]MBB5625830.1 DNA-binding GntR family transcriptional regulator [Sphaerisporangium krabiense]
MDSQVRILSAKDVVAEEIRALIYNGTMASGARISTDELAERFGVSRTPVRDALQQLSVEGLVTIAPRVGVFVREISPQEITDVYQIKTALEPMMAAWAAVRGTPEQRSALLRSVTDLERVAEAGDIPAYVRMIEERHEVMLTMAGSGGLRDALGVLDGRVRLLRFRNLSQPGSLAESVAGHRAVAEAIAAGDPQAAYNAMQAHKARSTAKIEALMPATASDTPSITQLAAGRRGTSRSARGPRKRSTSTSK